MAQAFLSSGFVGGRPGGRPAARLGSETFTANGTYNANDFNNAKGQPLDGFSQVTVNTPYEAILDGSVETIDTSVTTLRASAFANMTNLTKLVLRNASSLLSTIQNALPTDLSQGTELNIYVPSSSLDDYAALYGSVYTVNDISLYGRYWFTPTTSETTLTSGMYVSGITAYLTSSDPYDGLSIPSTITALGSGSLTPITSPTSALGIYDIQFMGNITAFGVANTRLTSVDSNFSDSACPITKLRYNGTSLANSFFAGSKSLQEVYLPNLTGTLSCFGYGATAINMGKLAYVSAPNVTYLFDSCFSNCTSLKKVNLPKLITVGNFNGSGVESVSFPNATSVARAGLVSCASLTSVNLPLVSIAGDHAFGYCASLTSVSFPSMITSSASIGQSAIDGCTSIKTFYIGGPTMSSVPTLLGLSNGFSSSLLVHVPFAGTTGNMLATFWNSTNWSSWTNYLVGDLNASVGDTLAGTSAYGSTTYNCKWYSDERCTIQVNTTGSSFTVATAGTYYCRLVEQ